MTTALSVQGYTHRAAVGKAGLPRRFWPTNYYTQIEVAMGVPATHHAIELKPITQADVPIINRLIEEEMSKRFIVIETSAEDLEGAAEQIKNVADLISEGYTDGLDAHARFACYIPLNHFTVTDVVSAAAKNDGGE